MKILSIKITRAPSNWKTMVDKRTRYIYTRYYIITNMIKNQEASEKLCTNLGMIGDYFMKRLQGYQFCRFRKYHYWYP